MIWYNSVLHNVLLTYCRRPEIRRHTWLPVAGGIANIIYYYYTKRRGEHSARSLSHTHKLHASEYPRADFFSPPRDWVLQLGNNFPGKCHYIRKRWYALLYLRHMAISITSLFFLLLYLSLSLSLSLSFSHPYFIV